MTYAVLSALDNRISVADFYRRMICVIFSGRQNYSQNKNDKASRHRQTLLRKHAFWDVDATLPHINIRPFSDTHYACQPTTTVYTFRRIKPDTIAHHLLGDVSSDVTGRHLYQEFRKVILIIRFIWCLQGKHANHYCYIAEIAFTLTVPILLVIISFNQKNT